MSRRQDVKKYARMFLNAVSTDEMPAAINELLSVNNLMLQSKEFMGLLKNPVFTSAERETVIKKLSEKLKLSDNTARLIIYLSAQRVIAALPELIRFATAIYLEKKNRARAVITTPVDIKDRYEGRFKSSLKKITGRDVDIEYVTDPSILGGILVRVGSTIYDSSIKGQLRLLKDDIMKE